MKRILFTLLTAMLITTAQAQVPQQLNYQGIARNNNGAPITFQNITVRISLLDSASGGQVAYSETRIVRTNYVGLFNILIGSKGATNVRGTMDQVNWSTGKKHIKLEIDPRGLNNFTLAGITELQSVPYALSASPAGQAGGDLAGMYPSPKIAANAIKSTHIAEGSIGLSKLDQQVANTLAGKINATDTASMLAPYETKSGMKHSILGKLNVTDTAVMLQPYYLAQQAITERELIHSNLNMEAERAKTSEEAIISTLATETTERKDAVATITTNLNSEISRATSAEGTLATNLATETTNRIDANGTIISNLNSEVTRATAAEALLGSTKENLSNKSTNIATDATSDTKYPSVKSVKSYVDAASSGSSVALANEITRATNAENTIAANLATETADRSSADATLTSNLNKEVTRAITAEEVLATNLATETTNRIDANATIISNLNNEVTRATAAEVLLGSTKENLSNKSTDITTDATSDTKYPSVKSVKSYIDAASSGSSVALANEITRATNAENTIAANLAIETADRSSADATLTSNLNKEVTRATTAEEVLATNLAKEATNRIDANATITANLNTEVARATNAENVIAANLAAETTNRIDANTTITSNLAGEVSRATAAEATKENLSNKSTDITTDATSHTKYPSVKSVKSYIDAASSGSSVALANEITRATNAENTIAANLATETADRSSAHATLTSNLNKEVTRATTAEEVLATNLAKEATNRIDANATITANLNTEVARATNAENVIAANLAAETTNRIDANTTITSNLAGEVSRATAAEATKENLSNKSTDITTDANSDTKYPSVKSVKSYIDAASSGSSVALANEITRATNAENTIAANLATETADRSSADATLTSNLNKEVTRATTAEEVLATNLAKEATNRNYANATIIANLNTEVTRATNAENIITANLATETTNRIDATATITANLSSEVSRATAAEATKENLSNKSTDIITDANSDTKYPSVKTIKDYVDANASGSNTALNAEIIRATDAENVIAANLATETANRLGADSAMNTKINTEVANSTNAIAFVDSKIDTEITNRIAADSIAFLNDLFVSVKLDTETENRLTAISSLEAGKEDVANKSTDIIIDANSDTKYPSVKTIKDYVDANASGSNTALTSEITRATNAENVIAANLATETENRLGADSAMNTKINTEVANSTNAIAFVDSKIDTEITNRIAADSISFLNDLFVSVKLDTETENRLTAISSLEAGKEDVTNKSTDIITDANSDTKYPSVKTIKDYVDANASGSNTALTSEITRATNAENVIAANLATETANRVTADSAMNTKIDTEVANSTNAIAFVDSKIDTEITNRTNAIAMVDTKIASYFPLTGGTLLGNVNGTNINLSGKLTSGAVTFPNTDGATGQVLTTDGSGVASWSTPAIGIDLSNDIIVHGVTVGKGPGENSENTAMGVDALKVNTNGFMNTAIGSNALVANAVGAGNTAVGSSTLLNNTAGFANVANGAMALMENTTGSQNIAIGAFSLAGNMEGSNNTAIGTLSGVTEQNLSNTIAIGYQAQVDASNKVQIGNEYITAAKFGGTMTVLEASQIKLTGGDPGANKVLTSDANGLATWETPALGIDLSKDIVVNGITVGKGTGRHEHNTVLGRDALGTGIGGRNTSIGFGSLKSYTGTGSTANNTGVGYYSISGITTGTQNTAIGAETMISNGAGSFNTAIGAQALRFATGNSNTVVGYRAGETISTGSNNTLLGQSANVAEGTIYNATAIGNGAIVSANHTIQLGNAGIMSVNTSGKLTTGAVTFPNTDGAYGQVLTSNANGQATWRTPSAGIDLSYDIVVNGIIIGKGAGQRDKNTVFGSEALVGTTTGNNNTANGYRALAFNSTGSNNTAVGSGTLMNNTSGGGNTAFGNNALSFNSTGANNTVTGSNAMLKNSTGARNIVNGAQSLIFNSSGSDNIAIGVATLNTNGIGNGNIAIGSGADVTVGNQENSIVIGLNAKVDASNKVQIGNDDITAVKFGGTNARLEASQIKLTGGVPGTNKVLTSDANGMATWADPTIAKPVEVADEVTATASQTSFILTQQPSVNSKVKMFVNGIRVSNTAYSVIGNELTYVPANNGNYPLSADDRIQFDYYY